ncbi:MAG: hypothetical protein ACRC2M_22975, partial [Planktothrix sp.]
MAPPPNPQYIEFSYNPGLRALYIFIGIILLIVLLVITFFAIRNAVDEFGVDGVYTGVACTSAVQGQVPDISSRPCCCSDGVSPSIAKFVQEVSMIGIPDAASSANSVCSGLCENFTPNSPCTGPSSGQFGACFNAINPDHCLGVAKP